MVRKRARVVYAVAGAALAAATAVAVTALGSSHRAAQAVLLVLPVVLVALYGGRIPAFATAAAATVTLALVTPPVGSVRVHLLDDLVVLAVFCVVAFVVGAVVSSRIALYGAVERQRALLLRSVSHDLRTPLAAIQFSASELGAGPEQDRELASIIVAEAARLDRMVENLLNLSRLESQHATIRTGPVDLGALVAEEVARAGVFLGDRELTFEPSAGVVVVDADEALLRQVVTNLLENAGRHTPPGTHVRVRVRAAERAVVEVEDDGPGIAADDAEQLFQPFTSGGSRRTTGLGLAISKAVVEAHGGTIRVDAGPTGGAAFGIELPLRPDRPPRRG